MTLWPAAMCMAILLAASKQSIPAERSIQSGARPVSENAGLVSENAGLKVPNRQSWPSQGSAKAGGPANPLFLRLIEEGIPVDGEGKLRVRLPEPTMPNGLSEAEQQKILAQAAGRRPLEEFLRNAVVAPFAMEIVDVALPEAPEPLRRVDVCYVAYGQLEQLFSEAFLEHLLHQAGAQRKSRYPTGRHLLSAEEWTKRNLFLPSDTECHKERYFFTSVALFDRVLLRTTQHVVITRSEESLVAAAALAPAFGQDKEYPNQWQPIQLDEQGRVALGPARPYFASASYTKVTRLHRPTGALFIEHHHLFAEPNDWFGGKNFLRSKLPLAVQEAVRKLRWQLRTPAPPPSVPSPEK